MNKAVEAECEFAFGPFRFIPFERRLLRGAEPLQLGSRAKEILLVLIEHAGDIVGKHELIERVWPDSVVEEGALRVHMAALRKTLVDGKTRYVENVHGLGYKFSAPLTRIEVTRSVSAAAEVQAATDDLPIPLTRMIGRAEVLSMVATRLPERRFMTITGPAGIGKTTVAVAAADALRASYPYGVRYIDLASIATAELIGGLFTSRLEVEVIGNDPMPSLLAHLRERPVLILLDNCDHLVEAVAHQVEQLLGGVPDLHILATSREPLRAQGEWVLRLAPLELPQECATLSAREALQFPAIQLFVERAQASVDGFELQDDEVPVVTEICRRLDGLPLAIEVAAGHIAQFSIRGLLARITTENDLAASGSDVITPRHYTLDAALDWSYNLLPAGERVILHRLSVFVGTFSLEAAQLVAAGDPTDSAQAFAAIASLIEKSLVAAEVGGGEMRYRLLETTRTYALRKLIRSGEQAAVARGHALYYCKLLERADPAATHPTTSAGWAEHMSNVRAALEWSFSPGGDREIGIAVAAAAAPCMIDLSLLTECRAWMERAIGALDLNTRGTRREMEIQAALAAVSIYTQENRAASMAALRRAVALAEQLGHPQYMLRLFGVLNGVLLRIGDFDGALELGQRSEQIARSVADPRARLIANFLLGVSHHLVGNQASAKVYCEAALSQPRLSWFGSRLGGTGLDYRVCTLVALTRVLWLAGYADRAIALAGQTLEEAENLGHPVSIGFSLLYTASLLLWVGRWELASEALEKLLAHTDRHGLVPYHTVGLCVKARLALGRGDVPGTDARLRVYLDTLFTNRHEILPVVFTAHLAEGLMMSGHWEKALATVDEALAPSVADARGEKARLAFHTPELLRIKARILASHSQAPSSEVEACLVRALEIARHQSALTWELRAATDLARLWSDAQRHEAARSLLTGVYDRFTEGFGTPDLVAARTLLLELR